jgi:hypothetical protein
MPVLEQLNEIATLAERGEEVMEMAIAAGQQAARDGDNSRAAIGALAEVLCRRYSEGTLETFAKNIGVKARTVRSYRAVVGYYSFAHVCNLLEQGAAWSLLRETAQAYPDQPAAADAFLERALDAHMTIEEAERELALDAGRVRSPSLADELAATLARVLDAVDGVPALLEHAAECESWRPSAEWHVIKAYRAKAQAIRDALRPRVAAAAAGGGVAS